MTSCILIAAVLSGLVITRVGCRQMCLSCQYSDNSKQTGLECATDPFNWPFGNIKARCPFLCIIDAHFDHKTGKLLFFYRGCTASADVVRGEGCEGDKGKEREVCQYSCEGTDYCNNSTFTSSPGQQPADGVDRRSGWHWKYSRSTNAAAGTRHGWHWWWRHWMIPLTVCLHVVFVGGVDLRRQDDEEDEEE